MYYSKENCLTVSPLTFNNFNTLLEELKRKPAEQLTPYDPIHLNDGFSVIPTFHIKDSRESDTTSRDYNLDSAKIKKILNKALSNGLDKMQNGDGHLIMRNSIGKWDDFIVVKKGKNLTLKSVLLQDRQNPNYFTKEGDFKLIIEKTVLFDFVIIA